MKHAIVASALLALSLGAAAETPKGDAERGRLAFGQCRTCHYPEKTYGDHNGPNLYGIFGRKAGSVASYAYYSEEMKKAGFDWTPELLDFWLANMGKFLPGSTMVVFQTTPQQRADIIEYLKQFKD
ncbi:adenylate cyclase [Solimonas fluminis]|uniref:Adenylate cyclase n=1 Tax=Solimonas fluminis TaxID=2086571 RepID=A0A2S5TGM6_9GAMM|nr:c-type cytochrome [Solimonas fluminis]PPE74129.1 adenylate cyclase [Solimonas fluminis]